MSESIASSNSCFGRKLIIVDHTVIETATGALQVLLAPLEHAGPKLALSTVRKSGQGWLRPNISDLICTPVFPLI